MECGINQKSEDEKSLLTSKKDVKFVKFKAIDSWFFNITRAWFFHVKIVPKVPKKPECPKIFEH